jgi:hypothetical protein
LNLRLTVGKSRGIDVLLNPLRQKHPSRFRFVNLHNFVRSSIASARGRWKQMRPMIEPLAIALRFE